MRNKTEEIIDYVSGRIGQNYIIKEGQWKLTKDIAT